LKTTEKQQFDVLIIGAGPIGLACGIAAQKAGKSYVIIDKGTLVNSLYNYPVFMTFFSTSERLEIGGVPFVSINPKPNRNEALEYYRRVTAKFKLNVHLFEEVLTCQKQNNSRFAIKTSKANYEAQKVIVATGFYDIPNLMHIPGEDLPKVIHYYKDPHYYAFSKVLVVGANNSSVDVALETYRKGAEVTMVIRGDEMGPNVKYWVRPDIENRIKEGSIKAYFNSCLKEIKPHSAIISTPNGEVEIENDFVAAMTGYQPNFKFLEELGVAFDENQTPSYNPETMETNVAGLYLAGVVCGGMDTHKWFIENSRVHAELIINDIVDTID
jgi:thioredoxin reductase (NADPH)